MLIVVIRPNDVVRFFRSAFCPVNKHQVQKLWALLKNALLQIVGCGLHGLNYSKRGAVLPKTALTTHKTTYTKAETVDSLLLLIVLDGKRIRHLCALQTFLRNRQAKQLSMTLKT